MNNLKALSKLKKEEGIWLIHDASVPELKSNEVLIKIKKSAICGTDVHIYKWDNWAQQTIPTPMVIGHEFIGTIEEVGTSVNRFKKNQRVTTEGHITCGKCESCLTGKQHLCPNTVGIGVNRQGAFCEYLVVPQENVFPISNDLSDDLVSIFDPFGNAVHTALSYSPTTKDVLITGAGPIGIMAAAVCRHVGARHIVLTDVNDYRLNLAQKVTQVRTVNVMNESLESVKKELKIDGFHIGLEMSGVPSGFNDLVSHLNCGGKISLLGILPKETDVDWNKIIFKGLFIKGIYGREIFNTWFQMVSLIQSGLDITPIITHHYSIDDFQKGFDAMVSGESGKVILNWS